MFETVKVANKGVRLRSRCHSPGLPGSSPASTQSSCTSTPRTSYYGSDNASFTLEDKPNFNNAQKEDNRCVLSVFASFHIPYVYYNNKRKIADLFLDNFTGKP